MLDFTDTEFVSIGHYVGDGEQHRGPSPRRSRRGYAASLPDDSERVLRRQPRCRARAGERRPRQEADVTRLRDLPVDLDFKPGGCPDRKTALAIIFDLSVVLGTRPSVLVDSGHGVHAHWVIDDGQITDVGTARRALVKRWGRLVEYVAKEQHGVHVDSVFDLPRMMRIPDSYNNKQLNGEGAATGDGAPGLGWPADDGRGLGAARRGRRRRTRRRPGGPGRKCRRPTPGSPPTAPVRTSPK